MGPKAGVESAEKRKPLASAGNRTLAVQPVLSRLSYPGYHKNKGEMKLNKKVINLYWLNYKADAKKYLKEVQLKSAQSNINIVRPTKHCEFMCLLRLQVAFFFSVPRTDDNHEDELTQLTRSISDSAL